MSAPATMSESALSRAVIELAELLGWHLYSVRRSDRAIVQARTGKGWPDLVLVGGERILAVELKSAKGVLTPEQRAWLERLRRAGVETRIWRPRDWLSGAIEDELRGRGR